MSAGKNRNDVPPISAWEMEIMQVLWQSKGLTIQQAQQALARPIGYTTVQTRLNRLVEKGLIRRSPERPARYETQLKPEDVSMPHLDLLLERVSGGSVVPLVTGLLQGRKLKPNEIAALRSLVDKLEQGEKS